MYVIDTVNLGRFYLLKIVFIKCKLTLMVSYYTFSFPAKIPSNHFLRSSRQTSKLCSLIASS